MSSEIHALYELECLYIEKEEHDYDYKKDQKIKNDISNKMIIQNNIINKKSMMNIMIENNNLFFAGIR